VFLDHGCLAIAAGLQGSSDYFSAQVQHILIVLEIAHIMV